MTVTIPKGSHYSSGLSLGSLHFGTKELAFAVNFDESCLKLNGVQKCDGDFNKLFGFSYGLHQTNSVRIGWKAVGDRIRVAGYVYQNGVRTIKGFAWVNPEQLTIISIQHDTQAGVVWFTCGDKVLSLPYTASPTVGYYLNPYFGGDCNAPETMYIEMNRVPVPARALVNKAIEFEDVDPTEQSTPRNIPNIIFWLIAHSIICTVIFSFIVDEYIGAYGIGVGVLSYLLIQYYRKTKGSKSIFNHG
jgi:hypothetical protein